MSKEDVATRSNSVSQKRLTSGAIPSNDSGKGDFSINRMSEALQTFADEVFADKLKRGKTLNMGPISNEIRADYESKGLFLESTDVVIDDATIGKYIKHPKVTKGAVVDKNRYREVAEVIMSPTRIYEAKDSKYIIYIGARNYDKGRVLKVVIHPNYTKKGKTYNYAKSIGIVHATKMENTDEYRRIK